MAKSLRTLMALLMAFCVVHDVYGEVTLRLKNSCAFTVWPAWLGSPEISEGGTTLDPSESFDLFIPDNWSAGRIWGRTGCIFGNTTSSSIQPSCETGDCTNGLDCRGMGGQPPFTIVELTLGGYANKDFYDVSLVDGYNIPMKIVSRNQSCPSAGCSSDVNANCPVELQVLGRNGKVVACKSACAVFQTDRFCCRGANGGPSTCAPTMYSKIFKRHCPQAYSYAYDDLSSTFTCDSGSDYLVEFCPGVASTPSSR